jgi:hypothetical protein
MLAQAVMTDSSRKTPPTGSTVGPRRPMRSQSQDDRDAEGFAARKEREAEFAEFVSEEITGKYEGTELEQYREQRPPTDRLKRLEKKHDDLKDDVKKKHEELKDDVKDVRADVKELAGHVSDLREDVAGAVGKLDGQQPVLKEMLSLVKRTADHASDRDHVTFTAKVDVDKAHELARVDVEKAAELAVIEVTKEEQVDTVKAEHDRRKRNLKIIGLLASGGSVIELLHRLGVL